MKVLDIVNINKNIQTSNVMLYQGTRVKIQVLNDKEVQVSHKAGRLFWVKTTDISV